MSIEGQVLDNTYRLVRLVAEGGMGLVFEATHARLAGRYAIKVLPQKWSKDPDAIARFDREARITSSLQHPNIVQIVDFNTSDDGTEYLVMEYLSGETLAARLARVGPMALDNVVAIVEQVAAGLAAAHSHGIVHRDLKPDNVLLVRLEGRGGDWAKILDFGISKVANGGLDTIGPANKSVIGTPLYMAPEQCEGRTQDVGAATDQFALAVITYEMLAGRRPFPGESIGDVLFHVLRSEPPPMNIDGGVEAVVRRALSKSSRDRFPSVTAFAEALRAAAMASGQMLEESGSHPYAVGEIARVSVAPPARRRRWPAALVAAAVVSVAIVFLARTARTTLSVVPDPRPATLPSAALIVPTTSTTISAPGPVPGVEPAVEPLNDPPSSVPEPPAAPPVRRRVIGPRAPAPPPRRAPVPAIAPQPPPFRPLPLDDDATLPLDENFNGRP